MAEKTRRCLLACVIAFVFGGGFVCMFWPWFHFYVFYPCFWTFEHDDGRVTTGRDDILKKKVTLFLSENPSGRMVYKTIWRNRVVGEYRLLDGRKEGVERWWADDSDELLSESVYRNGERDGIQKRWWGRNRPMVFEHYKDGKPDGVSTSWFETGALSSIRNYSNGLTVGENMDFTPSGKMVAHFWQSTNGVTVISGTEIMRRFEGKPAVIGEFTNGVLIRKWEEEWK
jgi:Uncharacterized protein conserved in bacteria